MDGKSDEKTFFRKVKVDVRPAAAKDAKDIDALNQYIIKNDPTDDRPARKESLFGFKFDLLMTRWAHWPAFSFLVARNDGSTDPSAQGHQIPTGGLFGYVVLAVGEADLKRASGLGKQTAVIGVSLYDEHVLGQPFCYTVERMLVEQGVAKAREMGHGELVMELNTAKCFPRSQERLDVYLSLGFVEIGRSKHVVERHNLEVERITMQKMIAA